jgi:hypothetical protein
MHHDDQRARSVRQPLLLNFVQLQPANDLNYCYDEAQRLNVITTSGVPVVAAAGGKAMLKTQAGRGED